MKRLLAIKPSGLESAPTMLSINDARFESSLHIFTNGERLDMVFKSEQDTEVYFSVTRRELAKLRVRLDHRADTALLGLSTGQHNKLMIECQTHKLASELAQHTLKVKRLLARPWVSMHDLRRVALGALLGIMLTLFYALKIAPAAAYYGTPLVAQVPATKPAEDQTVSAESWQP